MDLSLPVLSGWEATRQIKADPEIAGDPDPRRHGARHAGRPGPGPRRRL